VLLDNLAIEGSQTMTASYLLPYCWTKPFRQLVPLQNSAHALWPAVWQIV